MGAIEPPPHHLGSLEERCKLSNWGSGQRPARQELLLLRQHFQRTVYYQYGRPILPKLTLRPIFSVTSEGVILNQSGLNLQHPGKSNTARKGVTLGLTVWKVVAKKLESVRYKYRIIRFQNIAFARLITNKEIDKWTNGQTDRRTDRQTDRRTGSENYVCACPSSLAEK